MKPLREWDSVGWGFLGVWFIIFVGPLTYWSYTVVHEDRQATLLPYFMGVSFAVILAGIITATVNSILQYRAGRDSE